MFSGILDFFFPPEAGIVEMHSATKQQSHLKRRRRRRGERGGVGGGGGLIQTIPETQPACKMAAGGLHRRTKRVVTVATTA